MQFTIKDKTFDSGRLNAFQQLHVVRRLAPVTERLVALAGSAGDPEAFLGPLARTVGELPDADVDYILNACLDVTQIRQDTGGFARLRVNGVIMFPLDLTMLLGIAAHVLKDNLSGFFRRPPLGFEPCGEGCGIRWVTLPDGQDWLMRPVLRGLCRYEGLKDGTLSLEDVALMNDALTVQEENERRFMAAKEKERA